MSLRHAVLELVSRNLASIRAINRRYAKPRLVMSPAVRWCLLGLRLYLFILVGLLAYKFYTLVGH